MNYWLMKSEPEAFSLADLINRPNQTESWDGVRNFQARNFMRDNMKRGDLAFMYHSSCAQPGIVGIMEIAKEAYPDPTSFDRLNKHFDPKSDPAKPTWFMVDVRYVSSLPRIITLTELKQTPQLADFTLLKRGNRLSIMPVLETQWSFILNLI
jgi:predicted RNA-binding protein with PUA-like domain